MDINVEAALMASSQYMDVISSDDEVDPQEMGAGLPRGN